MQRGKKLKVLPKDEISERVFPLRYVEAAQMPTTIACGTDEVLVGVVSNGVIKFSIRGVEYKAACNMMFAQRGEDIINVKCSKAFKGYIIVAKSNYITTLNVDTADYIVADMIAHTNPVFELDAVHAEIINSLASSIVSLSQEDGILLRDNVVDALVKAYFYMIVSAVGNKQVEETAMRRNSSVIVLNRFYDLLKEHYTRERSVDYYAAQLGITPKYLSMVCRQHRGVTASSIIEGAVIRHAKMLLKQPGMSVQGVADRLNFTSQSFFGKYFKQRTGVSPSRYKER